MRKWTQQRETAFNLLGELVNRVGACVNLREFEQASDHSCSRFRSATFPCPTETIAPCQCAFICTLYACVRVCVNENSSTSLQAMTTVTKRRRMENETRTLKNNGYSDTTRWCKFGRVCVDVCWYLLRKFSLMVRGNWKIKLEHFYSLHMISIWCVPAHFVVPRVMAGEKSIFDLHSAHHLPEFERIREKIIVPMVMLLLACCLWHWWWFERLWGDDKIGSRKSNDKKQRSDCEKELMNFLRWSCLYPCVCAMNGWLDTIKQTTENQINISIEHKKGTRTLSGQ